MVHLTYYSTGKKEEIECNFSIEVNGNAIQLRLECIGFFFKLNMKDHVEREDFILFLEGKERKIILDCVFGKYTGPRKIVWKNSIFAVSMGGSRLEFGMDAKNLFLDVLKTLKQRI